MRVPRDCKWCRHEGNEKVCEMYRIGETCDITISGDIWHKDEFKSEGLTKKGKLSNRGIAINEKFKQRHGIMPKESR